VFRLYMMSLAVIGAAVLVGFRNRCPREHCDLTKVQNYDFQRYFGLTHNHFSIKFPDAVKSEDLPPFYDGVWPKDMMKTHSFVMYAARGSGKTAVRRWIEKDFDDEKFARIFLGTQELLRPLSEFSNWCQEEMRLSTTKCFETVWSSSDFLDLILTQLVNKFVSGYGTVYRKRSWADFERMSLVQLATIACTYYEYEDTKPLEDLVFDMTKHLTDGIWGAKKTTVSKVKLQELDPNSGLYVNTREYQEMLAAEGHPHVLPPPIKRKSLRLMVGLAETLRNPLKPIVSRAVSLTQLSSMLSRAYNQQNVVFLDGLDENVNFFNGEDIEEASLINFMKATVDDQMQSLILRGTLQAYFFFPKIPSFQVHDFPFRRDKIPVLEVDWTPRGIANFAQFMMEDMSDRAICGCEPLPTFGELVSLPNTSDVFNQITQPRVLAFFMDELVKRLQEDPTASGTKFVASEEQVRAAFAALPKVPF